MTGPVVKYNNDLITKRAQDVDRYPPRAIKYTDDLITERAGEDGDGVDTLVIKYNDDLTTK